MALSQTDKLLSLGLDTMTASRLVDEGWTAEKLKRVKTAELDTIEISAGARRALKRPPIPPGVLFKVLHASKRICCVCRTPRLPIIVHHIEEWHATRDHDEENLAVLCLIDHDKAHSSSTLSQNLTPAMVRKSKEAWEEFVRQSDAKAIIGLSSVKGANWDYVNLTRVFRLAEESKIELWRLRCFDYLLSQNLITPTGDIHHTVYRPAKPSASLYQCGLQEGRGLYFYVSDLLGSLVQKFGIVDVSNASSYSELRMLAQDGTLIFVQAPFYFRRDSKIRSGAGQMRTGYTKVGGAKIQFLFDAWESTSVSAHAIRLSGHKFESVLGLVSGSNSSSNPPTLQISCLGIGSYFDQIHFRAPHGGANEFSVE